jgi:hypothetical protein
MVHDRFTPKRFRNLGVRRDRKKKHLSRADFERRIFELQRNKVLEFFTKDVDDEITPTNYFIVEFNLKHKISLAKFKSIMYLLISEVEWLDKEEVEENEKNKV